MNKVKRLLFKYIEEENLYLLLKIQNVKGFKPKQKLSEEELNKLHNTDIEVVIK